VSERASFSVSEISMLAAQDIHMDGRSGTLFIHYFDSENRPLKQGMPALFLFYASSGDVGSQVPGGVLLSKSEFEYDKALSQSATPPNGSVAYVLVQKSPPAGCDAQKITLLLDRGGHLTVNGASVGDRLQ